jgi:hypothetical protein
LQTGRQVRVVRQVPLVKGSSQSFNEALFGACRLVSVVEHLNASGDNCILLSFSNIEPCDDCGLYHLDSFIPQFLIAGFVQEKDINHLVHHRLHALVSRQEHSQGTWWVLGIVRLMESKLGIDEASDPKKV